VTIALELTGLGSVPDAPEQPSVPATSPALAPAAVIPAQSGPLLTVSLTQGCEAPLEALKAAPADHPVRCHPCDEAVVLLLLSRVRRTSEALLITASVSPGTLCLG
jgi:hypothetical protein